MKFCRKSGYANRGMGLESDINLTNEYYITQKKAYIYKKPTPIKISKVDYNKSKIIEAFFDTQSTLDYNGIFDGNYIEFDAKETNNRTSFPLANIQNHQIEHIKNILSQRGIVFLIVRFNQIDKNYLLMGSDLIQFIKNNDRKSIPINYFEEKGYKLEMKYIPRLDYLNVLEKEVLYESKKV